MFSFENEKQHSKIISAKLFEIGATKRATNISACASVVTTKVCKDCGKPSAKIEAFFCRDRLCPVCETRRATEFRLRAHEKITEVERTTGHKFIFLTLTQLASPDLNAAAKRISTAFTKFMRSVKIFKGYVRSLEVKKNELWHVHVHAVIAVPPDYYQQGYLSQLKMSQLWQKALGAEYRPVIWVKKCSKKIIRYITKYTFKSSDFLAFNNETLSEYALGIKNIKLFTSGGILKIKSLKMILKGRAAEKNNVLELEKKEEHHCRFCGGTLETAIFKFTYSVGYERIFYDFDENKKNNPASEKFYIPVDVSDIELKNKNLFELEHVA